MEPATDYRTWISDSREAELALAAERARIAAERAASEPRAAAGGSLLSRLRRHRPTAARAVTH
jgi:hypothetical protein